MCQKNAKYQTGRKMNMFHKYNDNKLWDLVKARYWEAINHRKEHERTAQHWKI